VGVATLGALIRGVLPRVLHQTKAKALHGARLRSNFHKKVAADAAHWAAALVQALHPRSA